MCVIAVKPANVAMIDDKTMRICGTTTTTAAGSCIRHMALR